MGVVRRLHTFLLSSSAAMPLPGEPVENSPHTQHIALVQSPITQVGIRATLAWRLDPLSFGNGNHLITVQPESGISVPWAFLDGWISYSLSVSQDSCCSSHNLSVFENLCSAQHKKITSEIPSHKSHGRLVTYNIVAFYIKSVNQSLCTSCFIYPLLTLGKWKLS